MKLGHLSAKIITNGRFGQQRSHLSFMIFADKCPIFTSTYIDKWTAWNVWYSNSEPKITSITLTFYWPILVRIPGRHHLLPEADVAHGGDDVHLTGPPSCLRPHLPHSLKWTTVIPQRHCENLLNKFTNNFLLNVYFI